MTLTQHFFIEGHYMGQGPRFGIQTDRESFGRPCSKLFFCGGCGEVLARCPVIDEAGRMSSWHSVYSICAKCPSPGLAVPGSIYNLEPGFALAFPLSVLQREVLLHIKHWKKEHGKP